VRLQDAYDKYGDRADFYWVYVKEAHASDGPRPNRAIEIEQHKTLDDRREAAAACTVGIKLDIPMLIDDMRDTVATAFQGWPDRLFILSPDGTIAYRGEKGPSGFDVDEMRIALEEILAGEEKGKE
jgi:hypothetical protein